MGTWTEKALNGLLERAYNYLVDVGFSLDCRNRYRSAWRKFACYAIKKGKYSSLHELCGQYIRSVRNSPKGISFRSEEHKTHVLRSMRMLCNFSATGTVENAYVHVRRSSLNSANTQLLDSYIHSEEARGLAKGTLDQIASEISRFLSFIQKSALEISDVTSREIHEYCRKRKSVKCRYIGNTSVWLRNFMKFLVVGGILAPQIILGVPCVISTSPKIPDLWPSECVEELLSAIDRTTSIGKQDFAILIMAIRLGFRPCDIRALRFDNLHWRDGEIVIVQRKTKKTLRLPLPEDVGEALIDYIKNGRPKYNFKEVFLTTQAPYGPYESDDWSYIVKRWVDKGNIKLPAGCKIGFRPLRRGLATSLLRAEVPFPTISAILGHTSMNTTLRYVNIDIDRLRTVTLGLEDKKC